VSDLDVAVVDFTLCERRKRTMSTQADLPQAVALYIKSADEHDTDALVSTLTEDAVVDDEGRVHRGKDEIRAWNKNSVERFGCRYDITNVATDGDETVATIRVSGNFSRSPISLFYQFALNDEKVARLTIHS
jgi:limonene-1,2-epoxide hydrolase